MNALARKLAFKLLADEGAKHALAEYGEYSPAQRAHMLLGGWVNADNGALCGPTTTANFHHAINWISDTLIFDDIKESLSEDIEYLGRSVVEIPSWVTFEDDNLIGLALVMVEVEAIIYYGDRHPAFEQPRFIPMSPNFLTECLTTTQPEQQQEPQSKKENQMKTTQKNQTAAKQAILLEMGKTAITIIKTALKKSKAVPAMLSGYLDTPIGDIAIANIASLIASQINNEKLDKVAEAAFTVAYQSVFAHFDIQGIATAILENKKVTSSLSEIE